MHHILIELIGTKCLSPLTEIKCQKLFDAIGITVGNLDNRSQCFTMCCCLDVFAWGMKPNVYYLEVSILPRERVSQSTTADFFLMFKLAVEKRERLIQVNSTFAVKPQFHTEQRPSLSQEHSGLSVPISHCCLCALSKGQTDFGRQHSAQQTAR